MIARVWSARAAGDNLQNYLDHFRSNILPELKKCDGYVSATVFTRWRNSESEIIVNTFWNSLEAIGLFAGEDRDIAVVTPEAAAMLSTFDKRVLHFTVDVADGCDSISASALGD